jgi:hypothetical protein
MSDKGRLISVSSFTSVLNGRKKKNASYGKFDRQEI